MTLSATIICWLGAGAPLRGDVQMVLRGPMKMSLYAPGAAPGGGTSLRHHNSKETLYARYASRDPGQAKGDPVKVRSAARCQSRQTRPLRTVFGKGPVDRG